MVYTRDDVMKLYNAGLSVAQISSRVHISSRVFARNRPRAAREWVERVIYEESLAKGKKKQ